MQASEPRRTTSMAKTALYQKSPSDCFGYEPISMVTCSFSVGLQMLTNHSHSGGKTRKRFAFKVKHVLHGTTFILKVNHFHFLFAWRRWGLNARDSQSWRSFFNETWNVAWSMTESLHRREADQLTAAPAVLLMHTHTLWLLLKNVKIRWSKLWTRAILWLHAVWHVQMILVSTADRLIIRCWMQTRLKLFGRLQLITVSSCWE